jgi:myo-inositol-1(or 4)-monophosphatase
VNADVLQDLLGVAVEATHRAGTMIRGRTAREVVEKGDRDPASDVDIAAEQEIRKLLTARAPDIPVLGEEGGGPSASAGCLWVVDPIDGTVNYLHGMPLYAVSISLIEDGRTLLGVTHLPELPTTYTAIAGDGTRADGRPIKASPVTALRDAVIAIDQWTFSTGHATDINARRQALIQGLAPLVQRIRIHGSSAIDLAWTAHGKLDACLILANQPWDTSAGVLLAREAGARVIDLEGHPHRLASHTTVAAAPGIAKELHDAIASAQATADMPPPC